MDIQLDLSNKPAQEFRIYWKIQDGRRGVKSPKSTKFDPSYPTNHFSAWHLNPVHLIWTKFGMDILLDHKNKSAQEFLINRKIQDGRHSGVKCPKLTKFDPTITFRLGIWYMDLVHQIWTKFGMNILLDSSNKFEQEFIS